MRLRRGQEVKVEFLDHCEAGVAPIAFVVYGLLEIVTPQHLTVQSWTYADRQTALAADKDDDNPVRFNIVRSTVKSVAVLKAV